MEEEDEEEEDVVVLVVDALGGGAGVTGGISREDCGFMCPDSSTGRDRDETEEEDSVPWVSPTPSVFLHATIAIIDIYI